MGAFFVAIIAGILAYRELRRQSAAAEIVAKLENERFKSEQTHRERLATFEEQKLASEQVHRERLALIEEQKLTAEQAQRKEAGDFRDEQFKRFYKPAEEIGDRVARYLVDHPDWARRGLEAAKLLPYANTLFGERSEHFREEKQDLATWFVPYLLKRCEALASDEQHVFLLIDAGTTLYPFFGLIGAETMKRCQRGDSWLQRLHLVTNSLPGIEQLMATGRRAPWDRYSGLAIEDCHLLPGVPVPIFAEVAGKETNQAVNRLRADHIARLCNEKVVFLSLVVGNWVRIRSTEPRCPIAMARGDAHREVKQAFVENSDEIYVVSPLGKIFVGKYSNDDINGALGIVASSRDPEHEKYQDVDIDDERAKRVRLVSTTRHSGDVLYRHSARLEDALSATEKPPRISAEDFARASFKDVPNLFFPLSSLPARRFQQFLVEFPHDHTRVNDRVLDMFGVNREEMYTP